MRRARVLSRGFAAAAMTTLVMSATSCGEVARTGRSPVMLVIDSLEGASGAEPDAFGNILFSDVETIVEQQVGGQTARIPTIYSDSGRATFRLVLKNPTSPLGPSPLNEVTITRYRVTFRRSDGRNTPGVDVPHAFDGGVTATIPATGSGAAVFAVVRHQAKMEPPLSGLQRGGAANMISTIAEVTFYGRDQAGNEISTTGLLSVNFGDFGDPS
ncbi:MAG: hypothetical protein ACRD1H_12325 [Vicinamibacterales bacterium]